MAKITKQVTFAETSDTYQQFVDKFKPKKTTDDCYTPKIVFDAVQNWVCKEYKVLPGQICRPFWPGGDYERFDYPDNCVVLDNPPFSIISEIVGFYNEYDIKYFLFAPHLTNFVIGKGLACCHVIECLPITYENGATVNTSFVTNLDERLVYASPELHKIVKAANDKNLAQNKKTMPKYVYPDNVVTAANIGWIVTKGVEYELRREDAVHIRALDHQRQKGKAIFGSGFLISEKAAAEKAAAEKAAAEKAAAEKAAAEKWKLSERELKIIGELERAK